MAMRGNCDFLVCGQWQDKIIDSCVTLKTSKLVKENYVESTRLLANVVLVDLTSKRR